jgi:hypothetical protein
MVAVEFAVTAEVVTVKVALVEPAAMVILAGTVAALEFEVTTICVPSAGAGPLSFTVPVVLAPPTRLVGLRAKEVRMGARTLKPKVLVDPLKEAVMVAAVFVATAKVVTLNVALVEPAKTVTSAGTVAVLEFELRATTSPPVGATPLSFTVPVVLAPPTTLAGLMETAAKFGDRIVTLNVFANPLRDAVIVATLFFATADEVRVKVPFVVPLSIWSDAGTLAKVSLDDNKTLCPGAPLIPVKLTVPASEVPPTADVGLKERDVTPIALELIR